MAREYPEDEFDRLAAERTTVGAHRRPSSARPWLIGLLAVLILGPLVGIGIGNVMSGDDTPAAESTTAAAEGSDGTGSGEPTDGAGSDDAGAQESAAAEGAETEGTGAEGSAGGEGADGEGTHEGETSEPTEEPVAEPNLNHQVLVLNGRGVAGFAGENQEILNGEGFGNVYVADFRGGADPVESTIYYRSSEYAGTAQAVADTLGVAHVVLDEEIPGAYNAPIVAVMR